MRLDGAAGQSDLLGNGTIGLALGNQGQDLPLPAGQLERGFSHLAAHRLEAVERRGEGIARIASTAEQAETTGSALRVVWRMVFVPFAVYALVLVGLMYATFAAFATVLTRVACRRVQPQ